MMMVSDAFLFRRMEIFLTQASSHGDQDSAGLLVTVQTRNTRQPWRRCAVYRVITQFCKSQQNLAPELVSVCT